MYSTIDAFLADYEHESSLTRAVLDRIPAGDKLAISAPGGMSLGALAEHLITAPAGIIKFAGVEMPIPQGGAFASRYTALTEALRGAVRKEWQDADLQRAHQVYGMTWTRAQTLYTIVKHEIHHRGQLTVLLRLAGLKIPAIYGPSGDEK